MSTNESDEKSITISPPLKTKHLKRFALDVTLAFHLYRAFLLLQHHTITR